MNMMIVAIVVFVIGLISAGISCLIGRHKV